jgi:predicted RNA binding protein YcfA (HicA-like mRNA interferase family)
MKYREVAKKLKRLGCEKITKRGSGSHRIWTNPLTQTSTTIPDWGGKDLKTGTLRSIIKQLEIDYQTFLDS